MVLYDTAIVCLWSLYSFEEPNEQEEKSSGKKCVETINVNKTVDKMKKMHHLFIMQFALNLTTTKLRL